MAIFYIIILHFEMRYTKRRAIAATIIRRLYGIFLNVPASEQFFLLMANLIGRLAFLRVGIYIFTFRVQSVCH